MKNVIFYFLLTLLLFSCGNENLEKELPDTPELPKTEAQKIAEYHNVALDLYLKSSKTKSTAELTFFELHDEIALLMRTEYPDMEIPLMLDNKKTQNGDNFIPSFDLKSFLYERLYLAVNNGKISKEFADIIYTETANNASTPESIIKNLNIFRSQNNISEYENFLIDVYVETLKASEEYWTNYNNSENGIDKKLKGSSWVIIADAGGSIAGFFCGGICAPVFGAAASVAVNECVD